MSDYGISSAYHQDPDDPSEIYEGIAVTRVQVGGQDYTTLGQAWFVRVTTGAAGERFYGLAANEPDPENEGAVWHEGMRKATPDEDGEGGSVTILKDEPLTHIGVTRPGTVRVWDPAVNTADELIGWCERPLEVDTDFILVRLNV